MSKKKALERNIWKLRLIKFLGTLIFFFPISVIFFEEVGLSYFEIFSLLAVFSVAVLIFEIPSGILADRHGRKWTMVMSRVLFVFGTSCFAFGHSVWHFAIGFFLNGIGVASWSGSDSAFLFDTLKQLKREKEFKKLFGSIWASGTSGLAVATFTSVLITSQFGLRAAYIATLFSSVTSALVALTLVEPRYSREKKRYWDHFISAIKLCAGHERIRDLILYKAGTIGIMLMAYRFHQPYMRMAGIPVDYFGIIFGSILVVSALFAFKADKLEHFLGLRMSLIIVPACMIIAYLALGFAISPYFVFFIIISDVFFSFTQTSIDDYSHKYISSKQRASVLSVNSQVTNIMQFVVSPTIGFAADYLVYNHIYFFLAGIIVVLVFFPIKNILQQEA